ncbi:Hypothetical protein FKW44_001458, partial [Caligus rogercresseyi]
ASKLITSVAEFWQHSEEVYKMNFLTHHRIRILTDTSTRKAKGPLHLSIMLSEALPREEYGRESFLRREPVRLEHLCQDDVRGSVLKIEILIRESLWPIP